MRRNPTTRSPTLDGDPGRLRRLVEELEALRRNILAFEQRLGPRIAAVHPAWESSARNLVHYLALRTRDMGILQEELGAYGLQSFDKSEAHVMANLLAVLRLLRSASGSTEPLPEPFHPVVGFHEGTTALHVHTEALLGTRPNDRYVRVMVTLPSEAADDPKLARSLIEAGMDVVRINCAHDSPEAWNRMIAHVRKAARELGHSCRILMDLAGPKLRTGSIAPGPRVRKFSPQRNALGFVTQPARFDLVAMPAPGKIPVSPEWLSTLAVGDAIGLRDARGRERRLYVLDVAEGRASVETDRTLYLVPGTELRRLSLATPEIAEPGASMDGAAGGEPANEPPPGVVGELPAIEQSLVLTWGELLVVTADPTPGIPARDGAPARIPCSLPEILADIRPGERIWFDDGKIGGVVETASAEELRVRIVRAQPGGARLRSDKGINLPDSHLRIRGLTPEDISDLAFVVRKADLVALSFVRTQQDIYDLQSALARHGARHLGVILKVETRQALRGLPAILLAAMRSHPVGVMIARGDLAIECGFEQLADSQEEILRLCEAAHVPVVWATQVLETLTRQGLPSRSEVTDAASSVRAECVMLNKGPFVIDAVRVLSEILQRTEVRHTKTLELLGARSIDPDMFESPDPPRQPSG